MPSRAPAQAEATAFGPGPPAGVHAILPFVAYDEHLADRLRELVGGRRGVTEKRMFGGLAFLVDGKMAVAVSREGGLLLRVDPTEMAKLSARAHTGPFVMRGKELDGWMRVDAEGVRTKRQLEGWVERGMTYARSLPAKR